MKKDEFLDLLNKKLLILDGAMGTFLQSKGYFEDSAILNLKKPEVIQEIHKAYCNAGADMILTNTFGATRIKLKRIGYEDKVREINQAAVRNVRIACPNAIVVGELGPLGEFIEPLGSLTFDEAYNAYKEQVLALKGVDVIIIDTISDIKVLKAAIIAAKENFDGPVISSMTIQDGRASTGTDALSYITVAEAMGVDVIGINCGDGPDGMFETARVILKNTNKPFCIQPNAGLPKIVDKKTIWDYPKERFADFSKKFVELGANIVGGCCGTNPDFIREITKKVKGLRVRARNNPVKTRLCSRTKTIVIEPTMIVGERINPTNRKGFIEELKENKTDYIRNQAIQQVEEGADLLDINVGALNVDEKKMLPEAVKVVEQVVDVPVVIDTSDIAALENALKVCSGKPLINSVNGSEESLKAVIPLARKYGAAVIGLCVDENGVPKDVETRLRIAEKIVEAAKDVEVFVDGVVLTLATNPDAKKIIIETLKRFKEKNFKTILGISNISHGLPNRSEINSKFFSEASKYKLDLAILNPLDNIILADTSIEINLPKHEKIDKNLSIEKKLYNAILYGDSANILEFVEEGLKKMSALAVNDILISALEEVGRRFDRKEYFLPNVLASANTMKVAFKRLKKELKRGGQESKGLIMFATVENDVHDIGKNIVIALLESHNFEVVDLGINVKTEKIIKMAKELKPDAIALSALMTTTATEMEDIVKRLKEEGINVPVLVGGAVVNKEYADKIKAHYSSDALGAVEMIEDLLR